MTPLRATFLAAPTPPGISAITNRIAPLLLLVISYALLAGCATNPVTGGQDFVTMSEQNEIALGRRASQEVMKHYRAYDDQRLQAYIQRIGADLARHSHRPGLIYRFTLLDSTEVNAFALPGGYIYITRGILAYLNSEAELAAVLGHEIGHVAARHAVRQQSAATIANLGATLGAVLFPQLGTQSARQLVQLGGAAILRGYGREYELEADRLGAEYLARSGYSPRAMIAVLRTLKAQEGFERQRAKAEGREPHIYHGLFATHPDNDTRLQQVIAAAARLRPKTVRKTTRAAFLPRLEGLVYGDSPHDGIRRGNAFYHADLGFALHFPPGWTVLNRPDRLLATAPRNAGLIQIAMEDLNRRISPARFMRERLHLEQLQDGRPMVLKDLQGYTGLARINTAYGTRLARFCVIYLDRRAFIIAGVAKDPRQAAALDTRILASARSFHRLTAAERQLAKPLRLHIIAASAGTRFAELARRSPIPDYAEARLRLLNGLYPGGEPAPGQLLKNVQ